MKTIPQFVVWVFLLCLLNNIIAQPRTCLKPKSIDQLQFQKNSTLPSMDVAFEMTGTRYTRADFLNSGRGPVEFRPRAKKSFSVQLTKDINTTPSENSSTLGSEAGGYAAGDMIAFKNGALFSAYTPDLGFELYQSDGTNDGTILLEDILEGERSSYPNNFLSQNGFAYFRANNANESSGFPGSSIYKTNAKSGGTIKIVDVYNAFFFNYNVVNNGLVFYLIFNLQTNKAEAWRSDGTTQGTFMVASDVFYDSDLGNPYLTIVGNTAFFVAGSPDSGYELWKSDGSIAGTKMVKDIYPGWRGSFPYSMFEYKNELYFGANDGVELTYSFWKTDGSEKGTVKLKVIELPYAPSVYSASTLYSASGNNLFFSAIDYMVGPDDPLLGYQLYKTRGTALSTVRVMEESPILDFGPEYLTDVNRTLFFLGYDVDHGRELWISDGTEQGTKMVKDLAPGPDWSNLTNLCSAAGKLYFVKDQYSGFESFWSSDGHDENTKQILDEGFDGLYGTENLTASGKKLFFGAHSNEYGRELFVGNVEMGKEKAPRPGAAKSIEANTTATLVATIFPNPAKGNVSLKLSGDISNVSVIVTDFSGRQIWETTVKEKPVISLPAGKLSPGVYIVSVKNNQETRSLMLIRQ